MATSSEHRREYSPWRTSGGTPLEFTTPNCLRIPKEVREGRKHRERDWQRRTVSHGKVKRLGSEIENRAEINGEGSVSQTPNICVASDTTGISTQPIRDPHPRSSSSPSTHPSSISKGKVRDDEPLNHFLREN